MTVETDCAKFGDASTVDTIDLDRELTTKCVLVTAINCGGCIRYVVTTVCESGTLVAAGRGDVIWCSELVVEAIALRVEGDIGHTHVG